VEDLLDSKTRLNATNLRRTRMGLLESIISAAGTLSFKVKNALGVYDRETFIEDPLTPKNIPLRKIPDYGKGSFCGVTAQMNNINFDTKIIVDKINAERKDLANRESKIQLQLSKARAEPDQTALKEQLDLISNRRIELNKKEEETRAELKRVMDLIRHDYNLPADCDGSDPHWRV
jgi:hypothetical protein